jgi:hypothetical protein
MIIGVRGFFLTFGRWGYYRSGSVGFAFAFAFGVLVGGPRVLAFPCFASGLLALPLCGAAPTFLCRCKEK